MIHKENSRSEGKINTHFGMRDYYKHYKQHNEDPVDRNIYGKIINDFNKGVVDLMLMRYIEFAFPSLSMKLSIRKRKMIPKIKDGKLVNNIPVDYKATKELWSSDEEAREKKILVRYTNSRTDRYIYSIKAIKENRANPNITYYTFKPCREFQRNLAKRIFNDDLEAFDANLLYQ